MVEQPIKIKIGRTWSEYGQFRLDESKGKNTKDFRLRQCKEKRSGLGIEF
jgi:hypothetical protein